jgi:hypothetical protein
MLSTLSGRRNTSEAQFTHKDVGCSMESWSPMGICQKRRVNTLPILLTAIYDFHGIPNMEGKETK